MGLRARARRHVPALTAVLSVAALALVFGAATGAIPVSLLPPANDALIAAVPHANAAISVLAIASIAAGWRFVRRGEIRKHRAAMVTSFGLFAAFLGLYLYRVALVGPQPFGGPGAVERFVYLPVLAVHILLAILAVPFVFHALLLASTRSVEEIPGTRHRTVGRIAASLWLISFGLGLVVYALLHVVY